MFARSRAVEKRSIRLPNWWLTWGGWGGGGGGGKGRNRVRRSKEGMSTGRKGRAGKETEGLRKGTGGGGAWVYSVRQSCIQG